MLQELIVLANGVRDAPNRGEESGLTPEEVAFYDALADKQSAVDILGNDQLKIISHKLLKGLKANASIDWAHGDSARARLRVLVKRILRKFGYPPDLEDAAVHGVLVQAEALLATEGLRYCPTAQVDIAGLLTGKGRLRPLCPSFTATK